MARRAETQDSADHRRKRRLLAMSEISLQLDTYDDVFSDFDPRPYDRRALSIDFLDEAKRASRDMQEGIELRLLMPEKLRNRHSEELIKSRLKGHFEKHHRMLHRERMRIMKYGGFSAIAGIILMCLAAYILFETRESSLFAAMLIVFLEPAGWFLFWEGLNQAIFESRSLRPNMVFYDKMAKCDVEFVSY